MSETAPPPTCTTCFGYGYRIQSGPYGTINAEAAKIHGIKGKKVKCSREGCTEEKVSA